MICNLCPRRCGVERTPDKAGGVCAMPAWPVAARAMLHQWEEPCLVGERGAGAVFFSGCNLRCKFCQNGVISQEGYGKPITPRGSDTLEVGDSVSVVTTHGGLRSLNDIFRR